MVQGHKRSTVNAGAIPHPHPTRGIEIFNMFIRKLSKIGRWTMESLNTDSSIYVAINAGYSVKLYTQLRNNHCIWLIEGKIHGRQIFVHVMD